MSFFVELRLGAAPDSLDSLEEMFQKKGITLDKEYGAIPLDDGLFVVLVTSPGDPTELLKDEELFVGAYPVGRVQSFDLGM